MFVSCLQNWSQEDETEDSQEPNQEDNESPVPTPGPTTNLITTAEIHIENTQEEPARQRTPVTSKASKFQMPPSRKREMSSDNFSSYRKTRKSCQKRKIDLEDVRHICKTYFCSTQWYATL